MPLLKDKKVYFTVRFIWKHDVMTTIVVIVISYKYSFVILHRHCPLYIHVQRQPVAVARDVFIKPPLSGPRIAFDWYLALVAERRVAQPVFIQMVRSSDGSRGGYFPPGWHNCLIIFLLLDFHRLQSWFSKLFLPKMNQSIESHFILWKSIS